MFHSRHYKTFIPCAVCSSRYLCKAVITRFFHKLSLILLGEILLLEFLELHFFFFTHIKLTTTILTPFLYVKKMKECKYRRYTVGKSISLATWHNKAYAALWEIFVLLIKLNIWVTSPEAESRCSFEFIKHQTQSRCCGSFTWTWRLRYRVLAALNYEKMLKVLLYEIKEKCWW